jgi:hypothetical protein
VERCGRSPPERVNQYSLALELVVMDFSIQGGLEIPFGAGHAAEDVLALQRGKKILCRSPGIEAFGLFPQEIGHIT